ncbi:phage tail assembly chaperone [Hansschlegelia beijingensis]|uniref:Putative phage protein (TIGR02216 family) n=1 Tax=Hansschlegelia beijingensis TaxID=1133344 RepID=A0A7W6GDL6_9HYPH|nr:putative phage protein (TIGR02216 family) [Hansschlegelia beijingensis]
MLRLSPDAFWRATPREIAAAAEGMFGRRTAAPLNCSELAALMARFPDRETIHAGR